MWSEIKRKFFHLCALIYVVGLVYLEHRTYLIFLIVFLVLEFFVEFLRLRNEKLHRWFADHFNEFFREGEEGKFSGVFWMLLGVITTVAIAKPIPVAASALLYLILGDGVASLAGLRWGGPRWPHSQKRLSGSLACFLVCLFVGFVLLRLDCGWRGIFIGAAVATVVEALPLPLNDNFLMPVASAVALLISYGYRPFL